jgi:hypothetical protein
MPFLRIALPRARSIFACFASLDRRLQRDTPTSIDQDRIHHCRIFLRQHTSNNNNFYYCESLDDPTPTTAMFMPLRAIALLAAAFVAVAAGDAANNGTPSLRSTATDSDMARGLMEAMSQARPLPHEHRQLLLRLLEADDDEKAVIVDGSLASDVDAASVNTTDVQVFPSSITDGSGSIDASKYEFVCFWRPAPVNQKCYNL